MFMVGYARVEVRLILAFEPLGLFAIDNHAMSSNQNDSLLTFPCDFPIKVMGLKTDGFVAAMAHVARSFDPGFDPQTIELRDSSKGNYQGVTLTVRATSREQLDELYRTLSTHPLVKIVL
jgi:uncharacterized protein